MSGAKGIPRAWLAGSPFSSYLVPSLVLFFVVGGSCLVAAIALFAKWHVRLSAAFISGVVLLAGIVAQMIVIGYVSWLQPAILIVAMAVLFLAARLRTSQQHDRTEAEAARRSVWRSTYSAVVSRSRQEWPSMDAQSRGATNVVINTSTHMRPCNTS